MVLNIRHTGIVVNDLEASLDFWYSIFGFRLIKRMDEQGGHIDKMIGEKDIKVTTAKLIGPDNSMIELLKFTSHPDKKYWNGNPYSTGLTHIAFTVSSIDEISAALTKVGFPIENEPQFSPDGSVKVVYCRGPEGILLELVEIL
jgi:catechol 2,3-dioxygenase-like lactoylglutathione lyase family enzyme